jgi:hypothetical protein
MNNQIDDDDEDDDDDFNPEEVIALINLHNFIFIFTYIINHILIKVTIE